MQSSTPPDPALVTDEAPRILVVEDEFLIRMVVADHLRDARFSVVEAFNGDEAIAMLKSGAGIDLVFTDVRMPGSADGLDVLRFVKEHRPELPVMMTSGHLEPKLAYAGGASRFMPKPCNLDLLTVTIQAILKAGDE